MKHTKLRSIGIKCWLVWMSVKIMFNAIEGGKSWQMDANISANRFFSLFFIPFDGNFSSPSISRDTFTRNIYEWTAPIHYELLNSQKWKNVKSIGLSLQLSVIVQSYPSECMLFKWMCTNDNTKLDINAMQCQITSTYSMSCHSNMKSNSVGNRMESMLSLSLFVQQTFGFPFYIAMVLIEMTWKEHSLHHDTPTFVTKSYSCNTQWNINHLNTYCDLCIVHHQYISFSTAKKQEKRK